MALTDVPHRTGHRKQEAAFQITSSLRMWQTHPGKAGVTTRLCNHHEASVPVWHCSTPGRGTGVQSVMCPYTLILVPIVLLETVKDQDSPYQSGTEIGPLERTEPDHLCQG